MTTPHRVGQLAKARIEIAALCAGAPDPDHLAGRIVDVLQDLGWTPPPDPNADRPPLQGPGADHDSPGRREFAAARAALAARRAGPVSLPRTESATLTDVHPGAHP